MACLYLVAHSSVKLAINTHYFSCMKYVMLETILPTHVCFQLVSR